MLTPCVFFSLVVTVGFHLTLNNTASLFSSPGLSSVSFLISAVQITSVLPWTSISLSLFPCVFGSVPSCPIMIGITVTYRCGVVEVSKFGASERLLLNSSRKNNNIDLQFGSNVY